MRRFILLLFFLPSHYLMAQPFTMFPGDANNDGVANHYDILPIGVAYGQEGFPRPGATLDWLPQFHPQQWLQALPTSNVNMGFCDSDGNGLIDSMDISAIALNFDSTQTGSQPPPLPYLLPDTCFSCPKLIFRIEFDRDTAMVSDTFYAQLSIFYPPNVPPQAGALGIAFNLNYDPENVKDPLTKVFPDTIPGDLMFVTATNTLAQSWRAVPSGSIGFGAAGKGMNALFFPRPIGVVALVVEDMIQRSTMVDFWMDASDFLIINELEQVVCPGQVLVDTIVLLDPVDATLDLEFVEDEITLYPNPVSDWLTVSSEKLRIEKIEILSLTGQPVLPNWSGFSTQVNLDLTSLNNCVFLAKITTSEGAFFKKLVLKN
ncbi:MAG: T9SS type A sorting domain-containing protein [Saprospiraceae bacterium]|nr:T9SS type A sorting domain-containing protein [Saprospiraceae bacterium]MCF8252698.1 T9SS type A sorting domain-containing protein [Saprospiraceae bacterium]MCF8282922.1 T9SS type A sorting domain-containing protein [Bacteroidales bacterium]MCF8311654.1 T9SS type A sorting domain-containing protein [Saprospiraceae bacterium]MCF8440995.1 T9SS type A sorting domain-containing protein [Saprospiraceae bacterium]